MLTLISFVCLWHIVLCGQDCLSCTGVETTDGCQTHVTCTNDEVCFKQNYSTESGKVLYDFGCSMSQFCRQSIGTIFGRRAEGHHIVCESCCNNTRLCNREVQCEPAKVQNNTHLPRECAEIQISNAKDGVYNIYPFGTPLAIPVFCDMTTESKQWTIFQRRYNGSVDFYRNWNSYKEGFGNVYGEYWLGNNLIHEISSNGNHELRIDLSDFEGEKRHAKYSTFLLGDEWRGYPLHVSNFSGNVSDFLMHPVQTHNGMKFSTVDHDNDKTSENCAHSYKGGWWYHHCHVANLNGKYLAGHHDSFADGIDVETWRGYHYSLKTTKMMITQLDIT